MERPDEQTMKTRCLEPLQGMRLGKRWCPSRIITIRTSLISDFLCAVILPDDRPYATEIKVEH